MGFPVVSREPTASCTLLIPAPRMPGGEFRASHRHLPSDNESHQVFLHDLMRLELRPKMKDFLSRLHLSECVDWIKIPGKIVVREVPVFLELRKRLRHIS